MNILKFLGVIKNHSEDIKNSAGLWLRISDLRRQGFITQFPTGLNCPYICPSTVLILLKTNVTDVKQCMFKFEVDF
jgi:hypothetical protein